MKIFVTILACLVLLVGCGGEPVLETVADEQIQPVMTEAHCPIFTLPKDAAVTTMESDENGTIYFCDGYTVTLRTMPGGDRNRTILETTGFSSDALTLVETRSEDFLKTQCVWSTASEEGEQVGRLTLLDDGVNHHVLSCMTSAEDASALCPQVQQLMDSFRLVTPDTLNTGS